MNVKPSIVSKAEIAFEHLRIVYSFALKLIFKFFIQCIEINRRLSISEAISDVRENSLSGLFRHHHFRQIHKIITSDGNMSDSFSHILIRFRKPRFILILPESAEPSHTKSRIYPEPFREFLGKELSIWCEIHSSKRFLFYRRITCDRMVATKIFHILSQCGTEPVMLALVQLNKFRCLEQFSNCS